MTQDLQAYLCHTSPYYPQGNGINEAAHKALEASVSISLSEGVDFEQAVEDAAVVHNATPHSATGESPYFMLFGCEPTLPGWQQLVDRDEALRRHHQRITRQTSMVQQLLKQHQFKSASSEAPHQVGDWVLF